MSKRQFLIAILIVLGIICGFWIGAIATGNYAIKQINLISKDLNNEYELRCKAENELYIVTEKLQIEIEKSIKFSENIETIKEELEEANEIISDFKNDEYELVYIGEYKLTHYCTEQRKHICGTGTGLTATGTKVTSGRTIAVDPKVIPYGTEVYIEGYGWRVAEDCGGAVDGNHIDIAVTTHSQALLMGTKTGGVWVIVRKSY